MLSEERQKLSNTGTREIVDYIRTSIEILLNLKMDDNPQHSTHNLSITSSQSNLILKQGKPIVFQAFCRQAT